MNAPKTIGETLNKLDLANDYRQLLKRMDAPNIQLDFHHNSGSFQGTLHLNNENKTVQLYAHKIIELIRAMEQEMKNELEALFK